jgi:pimeloyl-ACP methyl ester carboxylesterase
MPRASSTRCVATGTSSRPTGAALAGSTGYSLLDLYADLECILVRYQPRGAVNLVGHSMGGNVAWLYAGVRPARVRRVVTVDGYCGTPAEPRD